MFYFMECAIGMARRAMALPDFKLVGPAIHLALPELFLKYGLTYGFYFINIGALWILDLGRHLLHIIPI